MATTPGIVVVLDNEPLQSVVDVTHPQHRDLVRLLTAVSHRRRRRSAGVVVVTSTVVRLEAAVDRRAPTAAALGLLRIGDEPLDRRRTDRAVELRLAAGGSPADAATAQLAEELSTGGAVTVYTSDLTDLPRLVAASGADDVVVRHI